MPCTVDPTSADRDLPPPSGRGQRHEVITLSAMKVGVTGVGAIRRRALFAAAAVVMLGGLAACSFPNVSMSSNVHKSTTSASKSKGGVQAVIAPTTSTPARSATTKTAATSTTATPTKAVVRPAGDLDTGSVTHKVTVGAFSAVIVYYTDDNAKLYRSSSTKTVRVSVHLEGASGKQNVLVNNFIATADDGVTRVNVKQDARSFAITPPQSYNSVVTIPATTDRSAAVKLIVELDFSVQVKPKSSLYAAQTALDSITIPLLVGSHS
jgi:cytoskeletal protein RodZ